MRQCVVSVNGVVDIESGSVDDTGLTVEIPVTWAGRE
jgi:hypothetical protein